MLPGHHRAKAGGKQSTKDATGKFARSAGSRLRRYNEAALQRDITQLLKDWAQYISAAQLIFLAAPGSNSRVLFTAAADVGTLGSGGAGFSGAAGLSGVLDPADARVRRVPFVTQRPTFSELKRVLLVLGSVREARLPEPAPEGQPPSHEQQQQQSAAAAADRQQQAPAVPLSSISPAGVSKKQVGGLLMQTGVQGLCKSSALPLACSAEAAPHVLASHSM